jgi:hypothetical protein
MVFGSQNDAKNHEKSGNFGGLGPDFPNFFQTFGHPKFHAFLGGVSER